MRSKATRQYLDHAWSKEVDGMVTCRCGWRGTRTKWGDHVLSAISTPGATVDISEPRPQRMFESWVEPLTITIPLMLQCDVKFRRILDYDGTDTGMIEILLPPEIRGKGLLRLPRTMFSDDFNSRLPEIPKRED